MSAASAEDWQPAFLATSALLGEPLDAAVAALGDAGTLHAAPVFAELRSPERQVRARAMARVLADVSVALGAETLA
jgi:hypothetical protein